MISLGWLFATLGTGLVCLLTPASSKGQQIGFQILEGIGVGILFPTLQLACQAPQSKRDVAMAVAIFTFVRSLGEALGVAIGGVIFQNEFDQLISMQTGNLPSEYVISGANAAGFVPMPPFVPDAVRAILQSVYADSLRGIWVVMTATAGIGLLSSFLAKDLLLNEKDKVGEEFEDVRDYVEI
jgi:hypothetical protein